MRDNFLIMLLLVVSATNLAVRAQNVLSRGNMVFNVSPDRGTRLHLNDTTYFMGFNADFNSDANHEQQIKIARVGDRCWLQMPVVQWSKNIASGHRLVITPLLRCATDSVAFPSETIYGNWAYYHALRQSCKNADGGGDMQLRASKLSEDSLSAYVKSLPWQPWMSSCSFVIRIAEVDGCGNIINEGEQTFFDASDISDDVFTQTVPDVSEMMAFTTTDRVRRRLGTAYVDFPINLIDIQPNYRNNPTELDKICNIISKMNSDSSIIMSHITLKGYASPDGPYDHNEYLARARSQALRKYIIDVCGLSDSLVSSEYVAEDWDGLRRYVENSSLPDKEDLLVAINRGGDPDQKQLLIAARFPSAYRLFVDSVFPRLRRTDYRIDYVEKFSDTVRQEPVMVSSKVHYTKQLTKTIETAQAWMPEETGRTFDTYRPLLAVKTNLLYDVLLAPNIELEMTLGRRARWSLMAEYCNPWWRWDRKDQSYQIQELGLELRRWFSPRCDQARPWLSGHFLGLYCAVAKYDLERNAVGDQGDVFSAGLSYGYSWPIASRWNLEFNIAAGIIAGERRHYNAEFDSSHLIYKYTKNLFYAGPTKLKLSLVYIIGKKCQKGGSVW